MQRSHLLELGPCQAWRQRAAQATIALQGQMRELGQRARLHPRGREGGPTQPQVGQQQNLQLLRCAVRARGRVLVTAPAVGLRARQSAARVAPLAQRWRKRPVNVRLWQRPSTGPVRMPTRRAGLQALSCSLLPGPAQQATERAVRCVRAGHRERRRTRVPCRVQVSSAALPPLADRRSSLGMRWKRSLGSGPDSQSCIRSLHPGGWV